MHTSTIIPMIPHIHKLLPHTTTPTAPTTTDARNCRFVRSGVFDFTQTCPHCQIAKPRNKLPYGLIMPHQPPEKPWQDISMDLIIYLPNSQTYNTIFIVVDRFSKMAHFIPTQTQISASELAQIFLDNVVRLHGFPRSIVSDRDPRFLLHF